MSNSTKECVLVTPVWNDSARLAYFGPSLAAALAASELSVHWVVADDGSSNTEKAALVRLVQEFSRSFSSIELQLNAKRYYKGGAIYSVWDQYKHTNYYAFVDADGAIDAQTVVSLLRQAMTQKSVAALVGIRQHTQNTPVRRKWIRKLMSKIFQSLVRFLSSVPVRDTQCGLKCIPASYYQSSAHTLRERGFVFDLELLTALQAKGCPINTVAIPWSEVPNGKIVLWQHIWSMLAGMIRIRKRLGARDYD